MIQAVKINFNAIKVIFRLNRVVSGPLSYRVSAIKKYYLFYIHHTQTQKAQFDTNILHIQKEIDQVTYANKIKTFYSKYTEKLRSQLEQKAQNLKQKQASEYEKQAQSILRSGMGYLSLYYESLQNMIEGRRQVLHNENFKFEDGKTVEQKRIGFEKYLSRLLGRKQSEMDKINEEEERKEKENKE